MANAVLPPLASSPKPKTLKEIEFDLWKQALERRANAPKPKQIAAPKP